MFRTIILTQDELLYTDVESSAEDLTFTITTAAHFVYDIDDVDAGRVVTSTHNYSVTDNLSNAHAAVKFTQADVKQMRVCCFMRITVCCNWQWRLNEYDVHVFML